jgi:hypothetical protein
MEEAAASAVAGVGGGGGVVARRSIKREGGANDVGLVRVRRRNENISFFVFGW